MLKMEGLTYTMERDKNVHTLLNEQVTIIDDCIVVLIEAKRAAAKLKLNNGEAFNDEKRIEKRIVQVLTAEIIQNYLDAYALRFYHPVSKLKKDEPSPARKLPFTNLNDFFKNYHILHEHTDPDPALTMVISKVKLGYDDAPGMLEWQWQLDFIIYFIELFTSNHAGADYALSDNKTDYIIESLNNEREKRSKAMTEASPAIDTIMVATEREPESEYVLFEYVSEKLT